MYGEKHIHFLQYMLKAGSVSLDRAQSVYEKLNIMFVDDRDEPIVSFLNQINSKIQPQKLKLLKVHCEVIDEDMVILISTVADALSLLQSEYSAVELEYFNSVMHELVQTDEKRLKQMFCLNLASSLPSRAHFTASQAENMLESCCQKGYLISKDGFVFLGPRCVWEFTGLFQTVYSDYVSVCNLCSELVLVGSSCSNCRVMIHNHCMVSFFKKNRRCSNCKKAWVPLQLGQEERPTTNASASESDSEPENVLPSSKRNRLHSQ